MFFLYSEKAWLYFYLFFCHANSLSGEILQNDAVLNLKILLVTVVSLVCLYHFSLYDFKVVNSPSELGIRLIQGIGASAIVLACIYAVFPQVAIENNVFLGSVAFLIVFISSWRIVYSVVLKSGFMNQNIIILGSGDIAQSIVNKISSDIDCGYFVSAHMKEGSRDQGGGGVSVSAENGYEGLVDMAKGLDVKRIVVAIFERRGAFPTQELLNCRVAGIEVIEGESFYEKLTGKIVVSQIKPAWLIFSNGFKQSFLRLFMKRFEDLVFSILLSIVFMPVILLVALLVKLDSKGPVLFSQDRLGKDKKPYKVYKFRSMVTDAEKKSGPVWAQDQDDRITRFGHFIRKTRLDELPQLFNVLKGEMSFVGPRPEREHFVNELEKQIPFYRERFSTKPGLTGWAQVNYGYGANMEDAVEKLNYELFYIKNMSIMMDLVIIFRTVKTVLFGEGAR